MSGGELDLDGIEAEARSADGHDGNAATTLALVAEVRALRARLDADLRETFERIDVECRDGLGRLVVSWGGTGEALAESALSALITSARRALDDPETVRRLRSSTSLPQTARILALHFEIEAARRADNGGDVDCRTCGHRRRDHIYEEGACRPGYPCARSCGAYAP